MEHTKRQALIVWMYSLKQSRQLKKFGSVHYISKHMKYAYIYVDQQEIEEVKSQLERLHYVRKVEVSHRPSVQIDVSDVLATIRKEQELAKSKTESLF